MTVRKKLNRVQIYQKKNMKRSGIMQKLKAERKRRRKNSKKQNNLMKKRKAQGILKKETSPKVRTMMKKEITKNIMRKKTWKKEINTTRTHKSLHVTF